MENKDRPVMPILEIAFTEDTKGLTKREYFAGLAMQGILANHWCQNDFNDFKGTIEALGQNEVAKQSILMADELLKALDK